MVLEQQKLWSCRSDTNTAASDCASTDVSCLCKREEGAWTAPAFNSRRSLQLMFLFHLISPQRTPDNPCRPDMMELKHSGERCIIDYDNESCPGVIMDAGGHSVKVKCWHKQLCLTRSHRGHQLVPWWVNTLYNVRLSALSTDWAVCFKGCRGAIRQTKTEIHNVFNQLWLVDFLTLNHCFITNPKK